MKGREKKDSEEKEEGDDEGRVSHERYQSDIQLT